MKCEVCGTENENGTNYCRNCGHELVKSTNVYQNNNTNKKVKNDDYTDAAIAIGIVAIILALLSLPIIPTIGAIIGIVLGCKGNKDNNNRTVAIILNIVALVIKIIQIIIWILMILGIIAFASLFNYDYDYDSYEPIEKDTSIIEGTYYCSLDEYETFEKIVVIDEELITIKDYDDPLEPYITGEYASKFTMVLNRFTFEIDAIEENANEDEEPVEHKVSVTGKKDDKEISVTIDHFDSYKCKKKFEGI